MRYGDNAQDSPPAKSYRLSKDLGADDYLTFGQMRPFVAKGKDAKKGCHELKYEREDEFREFRGDYLGTA
ncbi:MAG: hypothetical protein Q9210_006729 [Variospora velana]